jgi:murein DD-endopeptidase MepM/ murein hydrolase activator NlpD
MATLSPTSAHSVSYFLRRVWGLAGLVGLAAVSLGSQDFATAEQAAGADAGIVEPAAAAAPAARTGTTYRIAATMPTAGYSVLGPGATLPLTKGADVNGDGQADFVNPTGLAPRGKDAYGSGEFGASRTGHIHAGVDYVASAGQRVFAPISGVVTRIGQPYSDDGSFRYVEITNPQIGYKARVMYVGPQVREGERIELGEEIGRAQTLQRRYPRGITDHVHLEIARLNGGTMNAATLVPTRG